ncbi:MULTISPECIES: response regulator [unclassified Bradyrhizobium]|uniref:response regulator n=1 Tax=unclassified Bradyrhizobium TaxID=2631580 RepID=UPI001BA62CF5|nr:MULTISPECIES: response regulator [unclassified Bradyrhizobium]MBR1208751.1 response regulator [Bradyrhizobium sp. AUGA SZCCT0124]MBR1316944.1 response regulator [Bradyrhizobium sp. AUGA SZCCT0051]MBR1345260.1 response regulator [Bradyrhizobium sp. AUGA SZCCT0105]MBR1360038.1 response regulator [Bradyrhizobium sp. AUGA SZCCT0045]
MLLIEDDAFKAKRICKFLADRFPTHDVAVERSVSAGLSRIFSSPAPEAILLDMSLSTYDVGPRETGGRPQNFGGIAVLEHMSRRNFLVPVIVITQFDTFPKDNGEMSLEDIRADLKRRFPAAFVDLVYYSSREAAWEGALASLLGTVIPNGSPG